MDAEVFSSTHGRDGDGEPHAPAVEPRLTAALKVLASRDDDAKPDAAGVLADAGESAIPVLLQGLVKTSRDARGYCSYVVRIFAEQGLPGMASDDVVSVLASRIDDRDWETQRNCGVALGHIGTELAIASLRAWLATGDEVVMTAAYGGLIQTGDAAAHDGLLMLLAEGTSDGRWSAAAVLGIIEASQQDIDALEQARSDRSKTVREVAERSLGEIAARNAEEPTSAPDLDIVDIMELLEALDDSEAEGVLDRMRSQAQEAGDTRRLVLLCGLWVVRFHEAFGEYAALEALDAVAAHGEKAIPAAKAVYLQMESPLDALAAHVVGQITDVSVIPSLVLMLDSEHPVLGFEAGRALACMPDGAGVAALMHAAESSSESLAGVWARLALWSLEGTGIEVSEELLSQAAQFAVILRTDAALLDAFQGHLADLMLMDLSMRDEYSQLVLSAVMLATTAADDVRAVTDAGAGSTAPAGLSESSMDPEPPRNVWEWWEGR